MLLRFFRGLVSFGCVVLFTMALPGLMVWAHANRGCTGIDYDAVDYVRWFSILLLPCCVVLWFIVIHRILTGSRSSFMIQFLLFSGTIWVEYMLLSRGIWI